MGPPARSQGTARPQEMAQATLTTVLKRPCGGRAAGLRFGRRGIAPVAVHRTARADGGGPTFLGGVVGYTFVTPLLSIASLGLAAGALVYVFNEMMAVSRKMSVSMMATSALLIGLLAGFGTDFILTAAGT